MRTRILLSVATVLAVASTTELGVAASTAVWEGNRVRISGDCATDFVTLSGPPTFPIWDEGCVAGSYSHLAPEGSLIPGDEVMVFIEEDVDVVTVPAAPTAAPALGGMAPLFGFALVALAVKLEPRRRYS